MTRFAAKSFNAYLALIVAVGLPMAFAGIESLAARPQEEAWTNPLILAARIVAIVVIPAFVAAATIPFREAGTGGRLRRRFASEPLFPVGMALVWIAASAALWSDVSGFARFFLYLALLQAPWLALRHLLQQRPEADDAVGNAAVGGAEGVGIDRAAEDAAPPAGKR